MKFRPVGRLMAGAFLLWFSVYTYPSFLPAYAKSQLGAAPVMVGMIVGSYGFTQMLLRIPVGVISDALRRRTPFLILGMAASILSAVGLALVKTPVGALVFRSLAGVAVSTWVVHTALYSHLFSPEETMDAMGRQAAMQYGAQVVAMLLGGFLAQRIAPWAAFLLGGLAAAAGLVVMSGVPEQEIHASATPGALLAVIRDKGLLVSTLLATVFQFAAWGTIFGFTVNWASEVVGLDASRLSLLSATLPIGQHHPVPLQRGGNPALRRAAHAGGGLPRLRRGQRAHRLLLRRSASIRLPGAVWRGHGAGAAGHRGRRDPEHRPGSARRGDRLLPVGLRRGHVPGAGVGGRHRILRGLPRQLFHDGGHPASGRGAVVPMEAQTKVKYKELKRSAPRDTLPALNAALRLTERQRCRRESLSARKGPL